ncbi:hypothetical protein [Gemmatimonas sp.]|uniref:hypothetical protein n=1 Tax=Gemmatimonas sp. TaxID=1962908 RepID=UPI00356210F1
MSAALATTRRRIALAASLTAVTTLLPAAAHAQDRLIGTSALGAGVTSDVLRFGGNGYWQPGGAGRDSIQLRSISQISVPISLAVPLGSMWTVDLQSVYSTVRLGFDPSTGARRNLTLSGVSDVRVRATGRLLNDGLVFTAGINAPTGQTELQANDLTVIRASAAPALGLSAPPVGGGPAGTVGLVAARKLGAWAVAVGGSFEMRGTYQPVAALTAGAPSGDYQPGNVMRGSIGFDRLVGKHRLSISSAADLYQTDELRDPTVKRAKPLATVRLGPFVTTDIQLQLAVARVNEFVLWTAHRFRSQFKSDGVQINGSSANYIDGGLRTSLPLRRSLDLLVTADGRYHSGLAINQGLATSGVIGGSGTLGLIARIGKLSLQPYLRAQAGSLSVRNSTAPSTSFVGGSVGIFVVTRF